ncbi:MAG TPA: hypothetical protein VGK67_12775 [Myxococcales bacterium]|jgi:hypothetical protein
MTVFWFVASTRKLPDEFTEGIFWSEEVRDDAEVPEQELAYAALCRAEADSDLSARAAIANWFVDSGESEPPTLAALDLSMRRLTRREKAIADGMKPGEVLVRSVFVAYPHTETKGREEAAALFEGAVAKSWWQCWR